MITKLQHSIQQPFTPLNINATLKSITLYAWISAGIFFICYLYFVGAITFSVIKERQLQQETKSLVSTMSQQELQYLQTQKNLTEAYALQAGFIPANKVSFATAQRTFAWNVDR